MRKYSLPLAFVSFLFCISGSWPVLATEPVRISVTNQNISFLPAEVALRKGYFKDEGLDVELIRMNTPNTITALITGDIGYTLLLGSVIRGALRGMPLRVVASLLDSPTHAVVTKKEIKSLKELKGKTIGIGNFGGTDEVVAKMVFKNAGVDPDKELKIIAVGPASARLAALKENLVSAAIISPPADVLGKQMGFSVLVRAYDVFSFPFIGVSTTLKRIKESPTEVKKVTKALLRANRFIRDDKEGAVKILMNWGRVNRDDAFAAYESTVKVFSSTGNIPEDGLRLVIDLAKADLKIGRDVPTSEVLETSILREAQKELSGK
jgi:ABC-type nitrate/sulfonate/bicarbonate transport system substrate-binding protein